MKTDNRKAFLDTWCSGFTQHVSMFGKIKKLNECIYYIKSCAEDKLKVEELRLFIESDDRGCFFITTMCYNLK